MAAVPLQAAPCYGSTRRPRNLRCVLSGSGGGGGGTGASKPTVLSRVARVLKEKTADDVARLFQGTESSRKQLSGVQQLIQYWRLEDSDEILEDLEDELIGADFGPSVAFALTDSLRESFLAGKLQSAEDVRNQLKADLVAMLQPEGTEAVSPLQQALSESSPSADGLSGVSELPAKPYIVMICGVNGAGKTTTIGKMAYRLQESGRKVLLAAGDTFRAAACEQLEEWARRSGAAVETGKSLAIEAQNGNEEGEEEATREVRPSRVMFSSAERAVKDGFDVLIADTSGRLHTNANLMLELGKCQRSLQKGAGEDLKDSPHECLLVLDASTGLNMVNQAREFGKSVDLTGLILTKLDGTSRGGAVAAVAKELGLPVRFVGVGEGIEDLQPFNATEFISSIFSANDI